MTVYKAYRCRICGEVYLGTDRPKECPYCGAHIEYLKSLKNEEFTRLEPDQWTDKSLDNVKRAIELEVDNAKFYYCSAEKTDDENDAEIFERLGEIEEQHAKALADTAGIPREDVPSTDECSQKAKENYRDSHEREQRAIKSYGKFAREAEEPEAEKFFRALVEIETDHLKLSKRRGDLNTS